MYGREGGREGNTELGTTVYVDTGEEGITYLVTTARVWEGICVCSGGNIYRGST